MRVNISGISAAHNKGFNNKGVINFSTLIKEILEDNGHIADYDMDQADLHIVFMIDLSSPNTAQYEKALKILQTKNCIIAFDDWSIEKFYKTLENYLSGKKVFKSHFHIKQEVLDQYRDVIEKIVEGEYRVIFPAYRNGQHELLGIRGYQTAIDPSIYIEKPRRIFWYSTDDLIPVHASLATKWKDLENKKYTILNVRGETEDQVFEYYCKHRIVLSPEHYFTNQAGWWRNRYTLAFNARAVVVEDVGTVFGDTHAIARKDVTPQTIDTIFELQSRSYVSQIMQKDEISRKIKEIIR
jgi:hypothetical protein